MLKKLEENKLKREQNIAAYDAKLNEIKGEEAAWEKQKNSLDELYKLIDQKTELAKKERQNWLDKKKTYEQETAKWQKEASVASKVKEKFDSID